MKRAYLNIIPLGSYDFLIGMEWLDKHHVFLDYYNKYFTCLDEKGHLKTVQGIPREVTTREVSTLHLKKCFRKGCQIFASHTEETPKDKVPRIEDYDVVKEFEDLFKEIPGLALKRDIDFSIHMMLGIEPFSKTPYRMSTP
jgi:hypothetical protein